MFLDIIGGIVALIILIFIIGSIYFYNKDRAIKRAELDALTKKELAQILKEKAEIRRLLIEHLSKQKEEK